MSVVVAERVQQALVQLRLRSTAERLDSLLSEAARKELSFLDFLDHLTRYELESKQRKRTSMGIQIAHFPGTKTLADFDYAFQPSVDKKLMTELRSGRLPVLRGCQRLPGPRREVRLRLYESPT